MIGKISRNNGSCNPTDHLVIWRTSAAMRVTRRRTLSMSTMMGGNVCLDDHIDDEYEDEVSEIHCCTLCKPSSNTIIVTTQYIILHMQS